MDRKPTYNELELRVKELELRDTKRAEDMVRETRNIEQLLKVAPFGVFLIDLSGKIVACNENGAERLGKTAETAIGTVLRDYFPVQVSENRRLKGMEAIQSKEGIVFEDEVKERWYRNSIFPFFDEEGKPVRLAIYGVDVTEYKNALDALEKSEEKYRRLSNLLPQVVFETDKKGNLTFVNEMAFEFFGYRRTDFEKGLNALQMLIPEDRERALANMEKTFRGEPSGGNEYTILTKDGRTFPVMLYSSSVMSEGKPVGLRGIMVNLTEIKRAQEALRESEEQFRSLSENAPDIIYTLAFDGSFTYVNPAWKTILGYEREEVLGRDFVDFVKQEKAREYVRIFKTVRNERETFKDIDIEIVHKDGSTCLFNSSGAPNINRRGEVTGMVGLFKDITDQHKLEKQLRQSQRMEALGTLGGGIAHDFNNLLMGIQGRTSLMLMDVGPSHPYFEHLKGIEDYVKSAADLTKQLLGFARGGKYEVKPIDINEVIKTGSSMFGRTKKEIKIHWKYQKDVWTIEADQGQIEQVLMNLYVNAWQAMPSGGELYLQTENVSIDKNYVKPFEAKPGKYVKISVTDTGVGMDEATRQRIFDPFFTTKEMGRGTGLGLASAYGIIKNHGGFIDVYSEEGKGTTFNIYLPVSEKKVVEEKELDEDLLRGSETVLLVDDEEMIIETGEELLKKLGYELFVARSGKEATEIFEKNKDKIDIVILDMIMPDMSGRDTFDRLRKINPAIKVLLSSGYSINGEATEILDKGCDGFIQKPININQLSRKLREILDKK